MKRIRGSPAEVRQVARPTSFDVPCTVFCVRLCAVYLKTSVCMLLSYHRQVCFWFFCHLHSQVADDALEDGALLLLAIRAGLQEQQQESCKDPRQQQATSKSAASAAAAGGAMHGGLPSTANSRLACAITLSVLCI